MHDGTVRPIETQYMTGIHARDEMISSPSSGISGALAVREANWVWGESSRKRGLWLDMNLASYLTFGGGSE